MTAVINRLHRSGVDHVASHKLAVLVAKTLPAIGFIFVLGQVTATGEISPVGGLVLTVSVIVDVTVDMASLRLLPRLPPQAAAMERFQLVLAFFAYTVLFSAVLGDIPMTRPYIVFCIVWLGSFAAQQSVLVLAGERE